MRISVIELDFHPDSLDGFLKIFNNTEHVINVFTTSKNIKFIQGISYSTNIKFFEYSGGLKFIFLRKYKKELNSSNIIFINTIANEFGAYLATNKRNNIILRVHNANKQFKPFQNINGPKSWLVLWKSISYVIREVLLKGFWIFRILMNNRISYFTFPDNSISDYIKSNHYVSENKIIPSLPLKIFIEENTAYSEYKDVLNVAIIGAVDFRRRQYEESVEMFSRLYSQPSPPKIRLTLLGISLGPYGEKVVNEFKKINHPNFSLVTFEKQLPEKEFVDYIKSLHVILSPITANATTDIFKEVYGKTKTTGSILDFLKFGKVTLVPNHYTPPAELNDYVIKYNDAVHLEAVILDLMKDNKINALNQKSLQYVRENYSQESVLKKTLAIFTSIIKNEQNPK
jgi:glycosyltransferase involved in cell wall biosynthesis